MTTALNYKELLAQREALDAQIASARKAETSAAVQTARQLVAEFSLSVNDVFGGQRKATRSNKGSTVAPKYRNTATGETWTGRGKAPKWIAGQDRTKFLID
ncbi:H-NS histone family protein [Acidovorax delafieldii]|uniref:H-NS histone family protein n=1 Tax=Acidovorax delafieldii TaxID=47920 RepID=UPI0002EEC74A|nr:H-NS histone family protein [Acidovorax delafieldii]